MADFKISGKNVITQAGTDEPVLASNVTLGTGIVKPSNISDAASSTLSCTTDSTITVATADTSSLSLGMAVSGTNIPANAHIVTIPNSTSFTITSAATGGATSTLTFRTGITSAKIEDDAVTSAKVSGLVKGDVGLGNVDNTTDALKPVSTATTTALNLKADTTAVTHVKPHIQPGTLYPAVAGKLLDGSTSHGATYGVAQGDGRMYYYTDIRGSKPIKDPRIGAHFGSQRHKFKSIQLLEQETATHGVNVYSVDGREWIRTTGGVMENSVIGHQFYFTSSTSGAFIEVVGYFSDANIIGQTRSGTARSFSISVDGGSATDKNDLEASIDNPLRLRYVDCGSVVNLGLSATLGLHTLKIQQKNSETPEFNGIELIAQDTSSTATKSQIQIPSQNVVSYGKKFTVSGTPHYNPFATKGDGSASTIPNNTTGDLVADGWTGSTSAYWDSSLDTATSLGLGAWESGGNFYRPVNGGRVVKWVDSSGAIKTSVNMMPPEADCILGGSSIATGSVAATGTHNWSTQYLPQFGNRTLGSNLMAAMTDNGSYPFETRPGGGLNGAWNNTTGYGLAYLSVSLTIGKLYRIRFDASSVSGVASYIGPATNSSATNWRAKSLITAGTNITSTFKATANDLMIVMHTGNGAAAFTLANFTLYEIEEPSLQAEVAKTFHWREFGNGNANGGATGTYKDASMLDDTDRDIAYVMDDGLTSLSGISLLRAGNHSILPKNSGTAEWYVTFIGTGVTINTKNYGEGTYHIAQNLPYGTHVLKGVRDNANGSGLPDYTIDGIAINDVAGVTYASISDISFHQPKMPPIPEDAVVLADYMLMADFVKRTPAINDPNKISKGVRLVSASRDIYYDSAGTLAAANIKPISEPWVPNTYTGFAAMFNAATNQNSHAQLPYFGTTEGDFVTRGVGDSAKVTVSLTNSSGSLETSNVTLTSNITISSQPTIPEGGNNSANHHTFVKSDGVLGSNTVKFLADGVNSGTNYDWFYFAGMTVATPIHTSSHYQTFETPYLHELVGGDRNMEQNNLIVTPDGKSWDEVTRDVSYIGKTCVNSYQTRNVASSDTSFWLLDEWRGATSTGENQFNKDWVMAYDRVICLVDGEYTVNYGNHNQVSVHVDLWKNGVITKRMHHQDAGYGAVYQTWNNTFKRGDYIQVKGGYATINTQNLYNLFQISRR